MSENTGLRTSRYVEWSSLIADCNQVQGLTEIEKEKAKRAYGFLQTEFGDDFLLNAFKNYHPFTQYVLNSAPWTRKWAVWFAEALRELKTQPKYQDLLRRLIDGKKYGEAISVLQVAYKFSKAGFQVTIDPTVKISGHEKIPDLMLVDAETGEEVAVEVSVLGMSKSMLDAFGTMQAITDVMIRFFPALQYSGRAPKILAKKHLEQVVMQVKRTVDRAQKENRFIELIIDGVIELAVAPENDKQLLENWTQEHKLTAGGFEGPPYDADEIRRTKLKFGKEQRQLPHDRPTILVIQNDNLFLRMQDPQVLISDLEEAVYEYQQILAAIVQGSHLGSGQNLIVMKDQHLFIEKQTEFLHDEKYIILLNKFSDSKIRVSTSTISKIFIAFKNY
jgi:hypothetical protein